jgi:hypothetical protein
MGFLRLLLLFGLLQERNAALFAATPATPENVGREIRERTPKPKPEFPPDRLFVVGLAAGFPILAGPEIALQVFKHWQFGATGSAVPAGILPALALPPVTQDTGFGFNISLNPIATGSGLLASPFVRFFPTKRTFYFQLTWAIAQLNSVVTSDITDSLSGAPIPGALFTSNVSITSMLPTVSIGYFFWRHVYFFNISLGATILANVSSQVNGSVTIPGPLGAFVDSQALIAGVQTEVNLATAQAVTQIRNTAPFFPSVMVSAGLMF